MGSYFSLGHNGDVYPESISGTLAGVMIVTCDRCGARYKLDKAKLSGRGAKITCPRCRHVFLVYRDADDKPVSVVTEAENVAPAPEPVPEPTPQADVADEAIAAAVAEVDGATSDTADVPPSAPPEPVVPQIAREDLNVHDLDFPLVGIKSWKVKVKIGLIYDFSDYKTLAKTIQEGRITGTDLLSHNGADWTAIEAIPDLKEHFMDVWYAASLEMPQGAITPAKAKKAKEPGASKNQLPAGPALDVGDVLSDAARSIAEDANLGIDVPEGRKFVDPFEALRERQNKMAPGAKGRRKAVVEEEKNSRRQVWVMVGLWLVLAGVLLMTAMPTSTHSTPRVADATVGGEKAKPQSVKKASKTNTEEDRRRAVRERLEESFQVVEEEPSKSDWLNEEDEPQLIAVRPKEFDAASGEMPNAAAEAARAAMPTPAAATSSWEDKKKVGDAAAGRADWASAKVAYKDVVEMEPSNARYRERLGISQYRLSELDAAQSNLDMAASAGVTSAHKWLGHIARDQGDAASAMMHYNIYLQSNPRDAAMVQRDIDALSGG